MISHLLPHIRGRLKQNVPLAPRSWFKTGGAAEWLFTPADENDLQFFLQNRPSHLPITLLGACSNVILRDGGIDGVVIRLAGGFNTLTHDDTCLTAGAAILDVNVAEYAAQYALKDFEFLANIPGSIGGAVIMNAGAYGSEVKNILQGVDILTFEGEKKYIARSELSMTYRNGGIPKNSIILRAFFNVSQGDSTLIRQHINEIRSKREASQPLRARTGGSTFRNPTPHKAWELIDQAGCRGLRLGDAQISEKHCNFMLNLGHATSRDLEKLGEIVREKVYKQTNIMLEWEIKRLGKIKEETRE